MTTPGKNHSRLLILEDEEHFLHILTTMLETRGWECVESGREGHLVECMDGDGNRIHAALLDLNAGESNGLCIAEQLRLANPELPVVLMTGFATDGVRERISALGRSVLLEKPFSFATLEGALAAAVLA